MVILGSDARFRNLTEVLRGLRRVAKGVVLVRFEARRSVCTGFFVAPDLVMIPGFAMTHEEALESISVERERERWRVVEADLVEEEGGAAGPDGALLGLLRLDRSEAKRALAFAAEPPPERELVSIVHHPQGQPQAALSIGRVVPTQPGWIGYDADTTGGSSGAPVVDSNYEVVGMHFRASSARDRNEGLSRVAIVEAMRRSRFWPALAEAHQFADVAAAEAVLRAIVDIVPAEMPDAPPAHIRAALSPTIDPAVLTEAEREELKRIVANPSSDKWVLRVSDRRSILAAAGPFRRLRRFRHRTEHPAEAVIDQILDGPPYSWAEASEEELGWWIQVTRWFSGIADGLPTPAELETTLEQRRIRSRLDMMAGPEFRGRERELGQLKRWYESGSGPLVVTGVGGIGKSALLGRFAQGLGEGTLLLWLDFDRADIAPDDAVSILAALSEQVRVQAQWEPAQFGAEDWKREAGRLGRAIEEHGGTPPLLILDSFEAAQYSERYQELWPVIEALTEAAPSLRLCVTGRAEVPDLSLNGRPAQTLPLTGLPEPAARDWLVRQGVTAEAVLAPVLRIARGIPLILQLAIRYLKTGGRMEDLPTNLPDALVGGYLYQRILDRVHNPAIQPLASRLLILRRFSADMFRPLFEGLVAFPPGEPEEWCADLRREMSLFDAGGTLRLRTELRAATLDLLERENGDLVAEVERRAVAYYAARPSPTIEESAELVYHRLRLGDLAGAEAAWRDGCGAFLTYAGEELRRPAARDWLKQRLGDHSEQSEREWEVEAIERIRSARARGNERAVEGILQERPEPSSDGPLLLHRAYHDWRSGRSAEAESLLRRGLAARGDDLGVRALLAAIEAERGDKEGAYALLDAARDPADTEPDAQLVALLRTAALIQLTTDFDGERRLLRQLHEAGKEDASATDLSDLDVVLPELLAVRQPMALEALDTWPDLMSDPNELHAQMEGSRAFAESEPMSVWRRRLAARWARAGAAGITEHFADIHPAHRLALLGWRRWWVTNTTGFLRGAARELLAKEAAANAGRAAVVSTLALLASRLGPIETITAGGTRLDYLLMVQWASSRFGVPPERWSHVEAIMAEGATPGISADPAIMRGDTLVTVDLDKFVGGAGASPPQRVNETCLLFYLVAPGALEALVAQLVGDTRWPLERIY